MLEQLEREARVEKSTFEFVLEAATRKGVVTFRRPAPGVFRVAITSERAELVRRDGTTLAEALHAALEAL